MLTDAQEFELSAGGDCQLHYHSSDRDITREQVVQFQASENMRTVTASGAITYNDDILLVNTTSGAVTLTLPIARGGKSYSVVRIAGANAVTLTPAAGNTINLTSSVSISTNFAPVRIKALKGTGWFQV